MLNQTLEMEEEFRFGWMVLDMKVTGRTTKQTEEEDLFTQTETFMRESGKMIKLMAKESTPM